MSQAVSGADVRAEIGVVARSQYGSVVHRPDPDAEEPRPACHEADIDHAERYREVAIAAVTPHYRPCGNPACFGSTGPQSAHICAGPRGQTQICVGGVANRPLRLQTVHVAVSTLPFPTPPLTRRQVHAMLAVESTERSIQRGLQDAQALGWLDRGRREHEYVPGELAALLDGDTPGGGHYWRASVTDPSRRIRGYHAGVVAALTDATPVTSRIVRDRLGISEGERSLRRGLRDAADAGWLSWDIEASAYRQGPLARAIGGGDEP